MNQRGNSKIISEEQEQKQKEREAVKKVDK